MPHAHSKPNRRQGSVFSKKTITGNVLLRSMKNAVTSSFSRPEACIIFLENKEHHLLFGKKIDNNF